MDVLKSLSRHRLLMTGFLFLIFQNINAQTFTLNGTITGKHKGHAVLRYFRDATKERQADTTLIKDGKFQFTGTVTGVDFALLSILPDSASGEKPYGHQLFIEPGVVNVDFNAGSRSKPVITGSKVDEEYKALEKSMSDVNKELKNMSAAVNAVDDQLKNGLIDPETATAKRKEVNKKYDPFVKLSFEKQVSYVKTHPNSYVSFYLLYYFVGRLSNDSVDLLYNSLSDKIKSSTFDYSFRNYYTRVRKAYADEYPFDKLVVNEKAPAFTIYSSPTDSMSVNDFKGKVVILEFWGLYCFPCIKANPHLEDIRKKYGKDKLEIIAINKDQESDIPELKSYIDKNKLTEWIHVYSHEEVKPIKNLAYKGDFNSYIGLGVPRTVVIDKNGKLVHKHDDYTPEKMQHLRSLIDKLVNDKTD
jgi:thiol-disulfide isomerase/thioredoxin